MGRPKKVIEKVEVELDKHIEPEVVVSQKDNLLIRQKELNDLYELLKKEGFTSISKVEVALAEVNSQLNKLS